MRHWSLRLLHFAAPQRKSLVAIAALMGANVLVDLLRPWPLALITDYVLKKQGLPAALSWIYVLPGGSSPVALVGWLAFGKLLIFVAGWMIRGVAAYVETSTGSRLSYGVGARIFGHVQELSIRFHGKQPTGDLVKRVMSDTSCVRDLIFGVILPGVTALLSFAAMATVLWSLSHALSSVAITAAPLLLVLIRVFASRMQDRSTEQLNAEGRMMSDAEQSLRAIPVTQIFGREVEYREQFADSVAEMGRAYLRTVRSQLAFGSSAGLVTAIGTSAVILLGGRAVLGGELSVGDLVVFFFYLSNLYAPMESLAYLTSSYAHAEASARRVLAILDAEDRVPEPTHPQSLPGSGEHAGLSIEFENVTFGYEPGRPVLKALDLRIAPGERVALVGPSGAGKSTFVSLLPRFFDPWSGAVRLEGVEIRNLPLATLRNQISLVLQEPFLFPMTIGENIAYGRPDATQAEIEAAARAANAEEFIQGLPGGYAAIIGERGATLSGGQRQRIAIARALLKDSPILILDEPTSALDAETEQNVSQAIQRLMSGRTTLLIAHRMSFARTADRIVVLDQGRIVESGTHVELMRADGLYAEMTRLQQGESVGASRV